MDSSKKIFLGIVWSVIMNVVNALYGFIMIPILIRYFGKAEYGLIGLAMSVNAYMQLMDLGLTSTNVRFFSDWLAKRDDTKVKKLFSTCTCFYGCIGIINSIVLLLIYCFSDVVFNVSHEQDVILKDLLAILTVAAFINWFTSCYNQIIQATENVAWTQKRLLLTKLLMIAALLVTVIFKLNIVTYFLLTIASNWLILPWVVQKVKEVAPMISFWPKFDKDVFREILPYTLGIFSFSIFQFSYSNLRPVFLGIQGTIESVTDFKVIMGIVGICSAVCGVFLNAMLPSSTRIVASNNKEGYYRIAYDGTKYIMVFLGFCVFGLMCVDEDLMIIYVGEEYLYLIPYLNVILFTLLARHMNAIASLILGGTDIKPISRMTAVSAIAALLTAWFLIPFIGIGGVAISTLVFEMLQGLFYYLYYFPSIMKINSWYIFKRIFIPVTFAGGGLCYGISYIKNFISTDHYLNILLIGLIYTALYLIFVIYYLSEKDKVFIRSLIRRNKE